MYARIASGIFSRMFHKINKEFFLRTSCHETLSEFHQRLFQEILQKFLQRIYLDIYIFKNIYLQEFSHLLLSVFSHEIFQLFCQGISNEIPQELLGMHFSGNSWRNSFKRILRLFPMKIRGKLLKKHAGEIPSR